VTAEPDLSGKWTGVYNYPVPIPPVAFEAIIHDRAGRISGTTSEMAGRPFKPAQKLDAVIDGLREGHEVRFLKMYDSGDQGFDTVQYSGSLDRDGDEIAGTWAIAGMSGSFLMIRRSRTGEETALAAEEKLSG
jgi:hypothetical protein